MSLTNRIYYIINTISNSLAHVDLESLRLSEASGGKTKKTPEHASSPVLQLHHESPTTGTHRWFQTHATDVILRLSYNNICAPKCMSEWLIVCEKVLREGREVGSLLLLAGLLGRGFHSALQRALQWMKLISRLLQQEAGHKLLQVGGLLVILPVKRRGRGRRRKRRSLAWEDRWRGRV